MKERQGFYFDRRRTVSLASIIIPSMTDEFQ